MRMIVAFEKTGQVRHLGHLDLLRSMQRALRRSGLPLRYSQGFNPHAVLSFAAPLPVGVSGGEELMDVALTEEMNEADFLAQLRPAMPPSLPALRCRAVDDRHPKLMARLVCASYTAAMPSCDSTRALAATIPALLAEETLHVLRRTKSGEKMTDIRPMIRALAAEEAGDVCCFTMRTSCTEQATLKPQLLLGTLAQRAGVPFDMDVRLHRERLFGETDGLPVPLMEILV